MSIFGKLKASVGIGAAVVDTVIDQDTYTQGDTMTGKVKIKGGDVTQAINRIDLHLLTTLVVEGEDSEYEDEHCLKTVTVAGNMDVDEGEEIEVPFSVNLPVDLPVSHGAMKVWVRTVVDISRGLDPVDIDPVTVLPGKDFDSIFNALDKLHFQLSKVKNIEKESDGVTQKYEFTPSKGPFHGKIDKLEMTLLSDPNGLKAACTVDHREVGLSGLVSETLGTDESLSTLFFKRKLLEEGEAALRHEIAKVLHKVL